ncbi:putative membrane protein YfcA [Desulfohalotomaculum tongense]|uniref:sulfite exporter TauE/SafE family protein n=1 Tax=Desulforadius tongensis TaxID=1216062 RepID=UPI001956682A|nr:sulfite exporter TauE/SafE family protein [Desulforadius tongensis]MBM7853993.1 putative membrane protein YfcA [Desulforadius tongensis]
MLLNYESASIFVNPYVILLIGFCIGVMGAYFGSKAMFLAIPALNINSIPMVFAIGTDMAHACTRTIIDSYHYKLFKVVNWHLTAILSLSGIMGLAAGHKLILLTEHYHITDTVVRFLYIALLVILAIILILKNNNRLPLLPKFSIHLTPLFNPSALIPVLFGIFSGFLASFLGSGILLLQIPFLIYFSNLPNTVILASNLAAFLVTSATGIKLWSSAGLLGVLTTTILLVGVIVGSYIGYAALNYIPPDKVSSKTKDFLLLMSAMKTILAIAVLMFGYIKFAKLLIIAALLTPTVIVINYMLLEKMVRKIVSEEELVKDEIACTDKKTTT